MIFFAAIAGYHDIKKKESSPPPVFYEEKKIVDADNIIMTGSPPCLAYWAMAARAVRGQDARHHTHRTAS